MADFFEVKPVLVHEIISRIEQVHRYKRIGKKVDHRSIKYLDFEASEKTDSDIFIKLKNKEIATTTIIKTITIRERIIIFDIR